MPAAGDIAAGFRKEPVSDFELTDYERELRNRAWALLMPQFKDQVIEGWRAEMRRTRILTVEQTVPDRDDYARELLSDDYRSSGARFARLEMDIRNDRTRFPDFIAIANIVAEYDRVRERSMNKTPDLTEKELKEAWGRIEENRLLTATVQRAMRERAGMYRFALERLVITTPDDAAVGAERELLAFEAALGMVSPEPTRVAVYGK